MRQRAVSTPGVAVEEYLLGLVEIHAMELSARRGQPHHEHPALDGHIAH